MEFGTVADLVTSTRQRLVRVCDNDRRSVTVLTRLQRLLALVLAIPKGQRIALNDYNIVLTHLRMDLAFEPVECVKVLFLDTMSRLIRAERMGRGEINYTDVSTRAIFARAFELGAGGLILVHNHPSGSPVPSNADISLTRRLATAAKPLGITLHDHIIVAREGHCSFRQLGLL